MTSRLTALASLALAPVTVLAGCGGDDSKADDKSTVSTPDRSSFVPITTKGVAEVVDRHLGDKVLRYYVFDDEPGEEDTERYVGVRLRGADRRDTFLVTVYPEGGSEGEVVTGSCPDAGEDDDPSAKVTCFPSSGGGNVTITEFATGFSDGNHKGHYLEASGAGPKEREVTASYESFTKQTPISDKELSALLGDPYLGAETSPKINRAGEALMIAKEE